MKLPLLIPSRSRDDDRTDFAETAIEVELPETWKLLEHEQKEIDKGKATACITKGHANYVFSTGRSRRHAVALDAFLLDSELGYERNDLPKWLVEMVGLLSHEDELKLQKKLLKTQFWVKKFSGKAATGKDRFENDGTLCLRYSPMAFVRPKPSTLSEQLFPFTPR